MDVLLTDEHADYAWRLGLWFGAWYPRPTDELSVIAKAATEYFDVPLNETAVAYGRWYYRQGDDNFTEEQLANIRPYLAELTQMAAQAFEASIYYRRAVMKSRRVDPGLPQPNEKSIKSFAADVDSFLDAHPRLKFHVRATVRDPDPAEPATSTPPRSPQPAPQPYGVSHAGAEHLAAAWMRHMGALDAQPTQVSGDGGIDVISSRWIAQVKNLAEGTAVPVAHIRDLAGVAHVDGRKAALFTSGAYSAGGIEFADRAGIALFRYDAVRGQLSSLNNHAAHARAVGMGA